MKNAPKIATIEGLKIFPYISAEEAFLSFITDYKEFLTKYPRDKFPKKEYMRNGPKDSTSGLRPRETLGLVIAANVAMFESGDKWVPGWLVDADSKPLPEDIAHDGVIRCVSGSSKGKFMHFEQVMATHIAISATPEDIEGAIIREASRKSARDDDYMEGLALIILVDYIGELSDLRKLARDISSNKYEAIYLICYASENFEAFICVVLKNPSDKLGPIRVEFIRLDGVADVARMR